MKKQTILLRGEPQRLALLGFLRNTSLDPLLQVTIEPYRARRSTSQMGLYWLWINEAVAAVADLTGHTAEEIHEAMKERFLAPRIVEIGGRTTKIYSTKGLDRRQMSQYMDQIYALCTGELGIILPLPEAYGTGRDPPRNDVARPVTTANREKRA